MRLFKKKVYSPFIGLFLLLPLQSIAAEQKSLADLYENLRESVVVLYTTTFKKVENVDTKGEAYIRKVKTKGEGSGLLVGKKLILTAAHLVHSVDELHVIFYDDIKIKARVISSDIKADLSLLELEFPHPTYQPVVLGNSDDVRVGEDVFVIGAPYNISYTLTRGIISGRHRAGSESDFYKSEFFQTDAAVNPGNSGGPIFNMKGEVIAITSFIKSKSGGNEGLGFAVTINSAKLIMFSRPPFYAGIDNFLLNGSLVKALNVAQESAILVQSVAAGGIAKKIGLRGGTLPIKYKKEDIIIGGDIILEINKIKTDSQANRQEIEKILHKKGNQGKFEMMILRDGIRKKLYWNGSKVNQTTQ